MSEISPIPDPPAGGWGKGILCEEVGTVVGLLVGGIVAFAVLLVMGVLGAVLSLVFGLVILPFKLLGFLFRGLGLLVALPFVILFGVLGAVILGAGAVMLFVPFLPLLVLGLGIWWLFGKRRHPATS